MPWSGLGWSWRVKWAGKESGQGRALKFLGEQFQAEDMAQLSMWALEPRPNPECIITLYKNVFNLPAILIAKLVYCFTLKYRTTWLFHTFWQCKTIKFLLLNGPFHLCLSISTNHVKVNKILHLFYKPFMKRLTEYYWPAILAGVQETRFSQ